jgi:hypothetical protein
MQEFTDSSGVYFHLSEVEGTSVNKFAKHLVQRLYGNDYLKNHIFEAGKHSSRAAASQQVIQTVKSKYFGLNSSS